MAKRRARKKAKKIKMKISKNLLIVIAVVVVAAAVIVMGTILKDSGSQTCAADSNLVTDTTISNNDMAQIANPASVKCLQEGNQLEIRTHSDGSQSGYCVSPIGAVCEEWAFFRGECSF